MSPHCLLASTVFDEKFVFNVIESPLYISCFSLVFKALSVAFDSLIIKCIGVDLLEFILLGIFLSFLAVCIHHVFHKLGEIFEHYFFSLFAPFSLFSRLAPIMYIFVHLVASHSSLRLLFLHSFFFLPLRLDHFI